MKSGKKILCLLVAVIASSVLIACGAHAEPDGTKEQSVGKQTITKNTDPEQELTSEPKPKQIGEYALEECLSSNGVYIGYDDGSFDRFSGGGWCRGLESGSSSFTGMFLRDSMSQYTSSVNSESRLIVCADQSFSLSFHKIHAEVRALSLESTEYGTGYGLIDNVLYNDVNITVYFKDGGRGHFSPEYINGKPASEYEYVENNWTFSLPESPNNVHSYTLLGFKDEETITLGDYSGTKYEESTLNVDTTYYHCVTKYGKGGTEITYFPTITPTKEGYAIVDLSKIPDGKYVMLLLYNGRYQATVLTVDN